METYQKQGYAQNLESDYENYVIPAIERHEKRGYKISHKETNIYNVQECPYYFVSMIFEKLNNSVSKPLPPDFPPDRKPTPV